jgi:3'-phosphoadenosine 5'-phosphosulfate (PAPS) 3'-phosphatase
LNENILSRVIAAVEAEGEKLAEEFHLPQAARQPGNAPIDKEIEERLRDKLQKPCRCLAGEETVHRAGRRRAVWLVDPQDGTASSQRAARSAISAALLRGGEPVLGVVHALLPPDRDRDTIARAEGARPRCATASRRAGPSAHRPRRIVLATASGRCARRRVGGGRPGALSRCRASLTAWRASPPATGGHRPDPRHR